MDRRQTRQYYARELEELLGRKLERDDGIPSSEIAQSETRLKMRLPLALRDYYALAGNLPINVEHNRLYAPKRLKKRKGKLVFMEENQMVVFWGVDVDTTSDPEVFQANNEIPLQWFSEECTFTAFIIRMLRWQRGLADPL